jgi:hypothetical protein
MEQVIIFTYVEETLLLLIEKLYKDEYFGFKESAKDYVDTIVAFMFTIPTLKCKRTFNPKYGTYYCTYKHNSKTSWYISFDIEDNLYNIKNITNNHSADYPRFIRGIK